MIPKRVLVIGCGFVLMGLLAIWNVLVDLHRAHINFNFAVFLLPVGVGLLCGKKSSRKWAALWCLIGYVVCLILAALCFSESANVYFGELRGEEAISYLLGSIALNALLITLVLIALYSPRSNSYFAPVRNVT